MANTAEKFLLTYKDHFLWSILITTDKLRQVPRVAHLCFNFEIGFYYSAKSTTSKIAQIEKNPFVSSERKVLDAAWSDDLLKVGYSGKNDERLRAILVTVHSVKF
ncbi:MAG: hypothetical protein EZS28_011736 [Streblomastix strix]|uniref:Pyridoxamine 5'-phosphate oxidase putative domain-containing protein n=1 Tax=Streblomastix strix TaxID=222440 RepID=A0A5J4WD11_9EUKA|nr:MAG: hypothetical protein EZS28_011736 [Streblomastix strix]